MSYNAAYRTPGTVNCAVLLDPEPLYVVYVFLILVHDGNYEYEWLKRRNVVHELRAGLASHNRPYDPRKAVLVFITKPKRERTTRHCDMVKIDSPLF